MNTTTTNTEATILVARAEGTKIYIPKGMRIPSPREGEFEVLAIGEHYELLRLTSEEEADARAAGIAAPHIYQRIRPLVDLLMVVNDYQMDAEGENEDLRVFGIYLNRGVLSCREARSGAGAPALAGDRPPLAIERLRAVRAALRGSGTRTEFAFTGTHFVPVYEDEVIVPTYYPQQGEKPCLHGWVIPSVSVGGYRSAERRKDRLRPNGRRHQAPPPVGAALPKGTKVGAYAPAPLPENSIAAAMEMAGLGGGEFVPAAEPKEVPRATRATRSLSDLRRSVEAATPETPEVEAETPVAEAETPVAEAAEVEAETPAGIILLGSALPPSLEGTYLPAPPAEVAQVKPPSPGVLDLTTL